MNLLRAIPVNCSSCLFFYGDRILSEVMFALARQAAGAIILMASSDAPASLSQLADHHIVINDPIDLSPLDSARPNEVTFVTVPPSTRSGRTQAQSMQLLQAVQQLAEHHQLPLLIEGSHIPPFVDTFVQVFDHSSADVITKDTLDKILSQRIQKSENLQAATNILFLLTDNEDLIDPAGGNDLYQQLISVYDVLIVADMNRKPANQVSAVYRRMAGIILAAGASERLGQPKQLLDWFGQPFVRRVAQTALSACLHPVIVVTGYHNQQVQQALAGLPVQIVHNPDWQDGQSTSVRAGLAFLPPQAGGALFLMADQPQISFDLINSMLQTYAQTLPPVLVPVVNEQRGNPVLFDYTTFSDLFQVSGDSGGRQLFSKYPVHWLPWPDDSILLDVDTMEDYQRLVDRYS